MPDWLMAAAVPLTTAVIATAGILLSLLQYRRANYERAERLLDYATTGDVASARHVLGREAWVRAQQPQERPAGSDDDALIEALFRIAWAFDRIFAVRQTVHSRPRKLIDDVLGDWVHWWGVDSGSRCRYGRTAATLDALDPEEHAHLARLVHSMGGRACLDVDGHHPGAASP